MERTDLMVGVERTDSGRDAYNATVQTVRAGDCPLTECCGMGPLGCASHPFAPYNSVLFNATELRLQSR
jgi:hypothetical protein